MTERAALLEDAVSRLTAQREGADQALRLSEIEFLLSAAEQRVQLFGDLPTALAAMQLAADTLDSLEEPAFAPLKLTLAAELEQLRQSPASNLEAARRRLADLMLGLERLPAAPKRRAAEQVEQARWKQILDQLVRIRPLSEGQAVLTPLERATRMASLRLQLGLALAALEAGRSTQLRDSVQLARQDLVALFDPDAPAVVSASALLDELEALPLQPATDDIGATLRELRAIRAARSANAQIGPRSNPAPATEATLEVEAQ
nr:uroporphyrinogen-III C-methyltransferase [Pseudomarimonas arenosa]